MNGAPDKPAVSVTAERMFHEGATRVYVWFTPTGEEINQTLASLLAFPASELLHVAQVAVKTNSDGAHVVFELCTEHGTKDNARLVIDTVASSLGLNITGTEFVDTTPLEPGDYLDRARQHFADGVAAVLAGDINAILEAARRNPAAPRRPW